MKTLKSRHGITPHKLNENSMASESGSSKKTMKPGFNVKEIEHRFETQYRIQKKDEESSHRLQDMIKEIKALKTESPVRDQVEVNERISEGTLLEAQKRLKEIMQCAYLMQKSAFDEQIDMKFPFFFTQLNKIKMAAEKVKKLLATEMPIQSVAEDKLHYTEPIAIKKAKEENEKLASENLKLKQNIEMLKQEVQQLKSRMERSINSTVREDIKEVDTLETVRTATFKESSITEHDKGYRQKSDALRTYIDALDEDISSLQKNLSFAIHKSPYSDDNNNEFDYD